MSEQAVGRWLLAVVAVVTSLLLPPAVAAQAVDDRLADLRTTARVEQALGGHDELRAFDYALRVEAGVLTLGGALPSEVLRQEALALASATRGVGQVIDSLIVPVDSTLVADPVVVADASPDLAAPDTTPLIPPPAPVETPEMSTPEPLPPAPATATPAYHTVERGDTLFAIAQRYGVTVADLRRLNDLRSNMLSIGQRLRVR